MDKTLSKDDIMNVLDQRAGSQVSGLQYVVVDDLLTLFDYAGGWADVQNYKPMTFDTTMMGYSRAKIFTAVVVLRLVERRKFGLDDEIDRYL